MNALAAILGMGLLTVTSGGASDPQASIIVARVDKIDYDNGYSGGDGLDASSLPNGMVFKVVLDVRDVLFGEAERGKIDATMRMLSIPKNISSAKVNALVIRREGARVDVLGWSLEGSDFCIDPLLSEKYGLTKEIARLKEAGKIACGR